MVESSLRVYNLDNDAINWSYSEGFESSIDTVTEYWDNGGGSLVTPAFEGNYSWGNNVILIYHTGVSPSNSFFVQGHFSSTPLDSGGPTNMDIQLGISEKAADINDYTWTVYSAMLDGKGSVSFDYHVEYGICEDITLMANDSAGQQVLSESFSIPSWFSNWFNLSDGYGGVGYNEEFVGFRLELTENNVLKVYVDRYGNDVWVKLAESSTIDWEAHGNSKPTMVSPGAYNVIGATSDYGRVDNLKYATGFASPDYTPSLIEFYDEESRVGGGKMVINSFRDDFSSYYNLQGTKFYIIDSVGNRLFTGFFTTPKLNKDNVELSFKQISGELEDHSVKRDYSLDSGIVKSIEAV